MIPFIKCVHHQKYRTGANRPNRDPSFLSLKSQIPLRKRMGIVENKGGRLETDMVLAQIPPTLLFVPLKSHQLPTLSSISRPPSERQYSSMYKCMRTTSATASTATTAPPTSQSPQY